MGAAVYQSQCKCKGSIDRPALEAQRTPVDTVVLHGYRQAAHETALSLVLLAALPGVRPRAHVAAALWVVVVFLRARRIKVSPGRKSGPSEGVVRLPSG